MNVEQSLKEVDRRQKLMHLAADTASNAAKKYEAHMTLYNVAVLTGDKDEITRQRDILHNLLDSILDAGYDVGTHQREISLIVQRVHD